MAKKIRSRQPARRPFDPFKMPLRGIGGADMAFEASKALRLGEIERRFSLSGSLILPANAIHMADLMISGGFLAAGHARTGWI
jgi:hypothetical protein